MMSYASDFSQSETEKYFEWAIIVLNCVNNKMLESDYFLTAHIYRVFSHDVTAAILVSQNNKTAAMLVSQTNPVGFELFSYAKAFFCSDTFA